MDTLGSKAEQRATRKNSSAFSSSPTALSPTEQAGGKARLLPVLHSIKRFFFGALAAVLPILATLSTPAVYRSPYLLAYPAVVFSAWYGGLSAALGCAIVFGGFVELFVNATHPLAAGAAPAGGLVRAAIFFAGSLLVGLLIRAVARERERIATAELRQRLSLAELERTAALDRASARELYEENQARALLSLDGANAGFFEWRVVQDHSIWSKGFYRLHGLEDHVPAHYRVWRGLVHPEDLPRVEEEVLAAVRNPSDFNAEYRVVHSDGEVRWIELHGTAVLDEEGNTAALKGYCGDITRRKLGEIAMLQSEKLALAGRLSAAIAHEIKDPLEAASNLVYLARAGQDPNSTVGAYLEEAMQQLTRVSEISRQTLRFTRAVDRAELCRAPQLVESTLHLLRPKLVLANAQVAIEQRSDVPFLAAPGEVEQVLTNLLNNALDAMEGESEKRIRIRVRASSHWTKAGGRQSGVRISIADAGCGMTPEVLRNMREPFFTTKTGTGTGLGMWVVSELVAKYRGALSVRSSTAAAHRGTTFSVYFPAATA